MSTLFFDVTLEREPTSYWVTLERERERERETGGGVGGGGGGGC